MNPTVCRPALPMDTLDVLELTRTIWEGRDYVPLVWEDWLKDPEGLLAVAELNGRVVGVGKLTRLAESQYWMEGLRVDPQYQGRGIASHMHEYQLDIWQRKYGGVLRLATASTRVQVQHLCERTGFDKVAEYAPFIADPISEPSEAFTPITPAQIPEAHEFLLNSRSLDYSSGLVNIGWRWASPQVEFLQEPVQLGQAWWWQARRGLLVAWDDSESEIPQFDLLAIATSDDAIVDLLLDYRRLCAERGQEQVYWHAPLNPQLLLSLEKAGFVRDWEHSIYIYEKRQCASA